MAEGSYFKLKSGASLLTRSVVDAHAIEFRNDVPTFVRYRQDVEKFKGGTDVVECDKEGVEVGHVPDDPNAGNKEKFAGAASYTVAGDHRPTVEVKKKKAALEASTDITKLTVEEAKAVIADENDQDVLQAYRKAEEVRKPPRVSLLAFLDSVLVDDESESEPDDEDEEDDEEEDWTDDEA